MNLNEFIQETTKIEKFYGKQLEDFERDMWFQELKSLPLKRYEQLVKKAFSECKFMPKLADIIAINKELPYNTNNNVITQKVECKKCNGTGVIQYFKTIEGRQYEYFARCTCQNGNEFNYDGTKISDTEHRSKFYIPLITQLGF